jgi:hypothetical protein
VVQPFFDDGVVAAARRAPLQERTEERLVHDVLQSLVPGLADIPFAGDKWAFEKLTKPAVSTPAVPARAASPRARDWRTAYGPIVAGYFRDYVLADTRIFDFLDRKRVEAILGAERQDARTVWCIATLTTLANGDWMRPSNGKQTLPVPLD